MTTSTASGADLSRTRHTLLGRRGADDVRYVAHDCEICEDDWGNDGPPLEGPDAVEAVANVLRLAPPLTAPKLRALALVLDEANIPWVPAPGDTWHRPSALGASAALLERVARALGLAPDARLEDVLARCEATR